MKRRGYSLLWVLFASMAALAFTLFVVMQFVDASQPGAADIGERMTAGYWLADLRPALIMVATTTASIWLTLHFALRPIRRLSSRAGRIGPDSLHERLPIDQAPTEIAPLVSAFNQSLERLETAWAAQRAFSAHAAHELRTPLAALRAHVESLLPPTERGAATAEFDRLGRLIEQLLLLAEADQDHLNRHEAFDLVALVRDTALEMTPGILSHGRIIVFGSEAELLERRGEPILASIAIRNLIDNAVRHTPQRTQIEVGISSAGVVTVRDDGPGVPEAFEDRLFERFARSDGHSGGAGLGLSIVARVMALHLGRAWFERLPDGAAFHLEFPDTEPNVSGP